MISTVNSFQIAIWWHCPSSMRSVTLLIDSMAGFILSSMPYLHKNIISLHNIPSVSHNGNYILTQSFPQADLKPGLSLPWQSEKIIKQKKMSYPTIDFNLTFVFYFSTNWHLGREISWQRLQSDATHVEVHPAWHTNQNSTELDSQCLL